MIQRTNITTQIEKSLWEIASQLRSNVLLRHDQINAVILSFVLIRRIECVLEPCRADMYQAYSDNVNRLDESAMHDLLCKISKTDYFNTTNLSLGKITTSHGDYFSQMMSYARGFSYNVFGNLLRLQFDSLLAQLNYGKVLSNVINHIAGLDLNPTVLTNIQLSDVISRFSQPEQNKFAGEYTSAEFFSLIVPALLFDKELRSASINIYDPVCGTGKLLRDTALSACQIYLKDSESPKSVHMYGQEINPSSCATAAIVSMIMGEDSHNIACGNVLAEDSFADKQFQYIVADLPMGLRLSDDFLKRIQFDSRFAAGVPSRGDAALLFFQHIISKMDPKGSRAAIISSASALVAGDCRSGESNIRRWMLEKDLVEAIVALPKNISRFTSVQQYLWILSNNKPASRKDKVRLIDCNRILEQEGGHFHNDFDLVNFVRTRLYNKDLDNCSVQVSNKAFGKYQITLVNDKNSKKRQVTVPMTESVQVYLKTQGYELKDEPYNSCVRDEYDSYEEEKLVWYIDYPATEALYEIDFKSFFSTVETLENTAALSQRVLSSLQEASSLISQLQEAKLPVPNSNLKKTNSDWYGAVPLNWSYSAAGLYYEVIAGRSDAAPISEDDELPYLSLPYLRGNSKAEKLSSKQKAIKSKTIVTDQDILVVKSGANAGEVLRGKEGVLSNSLFVVRSTDPGILNPQYLAYFIMSAENYLRANLSGTAISHLSAKTLQDMPIYLPTLKEQIRISQYLDGICDKINRLCKLGFSNIDLLQFQKSLIYEAVTGKLDLDDMK